jgi:hypothetical protein
MRFFPVGRKVGCDHTTACAYHIVVNLQEICVSYRKQTRQCYTQHLFTFLFDPLKEVSTDFFFLFLFVCLFSSVHWSSTLVQNTKKLKIFTCAVIVAPVHDT